MNFTAEFAAPSTARLPQDCLDEARDVIGAGLDALTALRDGLDTRLLVAVDHIARCNGRVVLLGMGKSAIAARKIAATLCSLGTPSHFLHAADALHGDLGAIAPGDVLVAISVSGATREIAPVIAYAQSQGVFVIAITAAAASPVARQSDLLLPIPALREGCLHNIAPMASTIATLALGDCLAVLVARAQQFSRRDVAALHPAGKIGQRLRPIAQIMHGGDRVPVVSADATMAEVVAEISAKGFGITAVIDARSGDLLGAITDGDLRRHFADRDRAIARDLMSADPVSLDEDEDVDRALDLMRQHRLSALFVTTRQARSVGGIVHIQDLLRSGPALLHG
ncbi:KpsF/GutQ family sugar-phosphate isomerase [soil metagenome]